MLWHKRRTAPVEPTDDITWLDTIGVGYILGKAQITGSPDVIWHDIHWWVSTKTCMNISQVDIENKFNSESLNKIKRCSLKYVCENINCKMLAVLFKGPFY